MQSRSCSAQKARTAGGDLIGPQHENLDFNRSFFFLVSAQGKQKHALDQKQLFGWAAAMRGWNEWSLKTCSWPAGGALISNLIWKAIKQKTETEKNVGLWQCALEPATSGGSMFFLSLSLCILLFWFRLFSTLIFYSCFLFCSFSFFLPPSFPKPPNRKSFFPSLFLLLPPSFLPSSCWPSRSLSLALSLSLCLF